MNNDFLNNFFAEDNGVELPVKILIVTIVTLFIDAMIENNLTTNQIKNILNSANINLIDEMKEGDL